MRTISRHALLSALLAGALLPSCQLESYELPAEELYTRSFIKQFGVIDKNQDWNLAERKSVTVNPGSADQVKVYAYVGNTKYIFANYSDVKGTQTLEFDLPEGVEDIIVKVNGVEKTTKVGGTVEFSGVKTRTVHTSGDPKITVSTTEYKQLTSDDIISYRDMLPEEDKTNKTKSEVSTDFMFRSEGSILLYPVYWQTNNKNIIGIYYYDDAGNREEIDVYTQKEGDELQSSKLTKLDYASKTFLYNRDEFKKFSNGKLFSEYTEEDWSNLQKEIESWVTQGTPHVNIDKESVSADGTTVDVVTYMESSWENITSTDVDQNATNKEATFLYQSKGIKIDIPERTKFGFYTKVGEGHQFYSEVKLNDDEKAPAHVCTYKTTDADGEDFYCLGFEDWYNDETCDLNDLIFRIYAAVPDEPLPDLEDDKDQPFAWLVACEDLGDTGDIDFNDIVFKVEYISGKEYATFIPLATGATLESYVYYLRDGATDVESVATTEFESEIHVLLGGSAPNFINTTDNRGSDSNKSKISLNVGKEFSMAYIGEEGKTKQNMGDFVIKTFGREKDTSTGWEAVTIVSGSDKGDAPMMICLPYEYEKGGKTYKWAWPKERVSIKEAYSGFEQWVGNSSYTDWYKYPNDGYVVTDPQGSSVTTTKTTK